MGEKPEQVERRGITLVPQGRRAGRAVRLVSARGRDEDSALGRWRAAERLGGAQRAGLQPRDRRADRRGRLRDRRGGRRRGPTAPSGLPDMARDVARQARRAVLPHPRSWCTGTGTSSPRIVTSEHGKVLSDAAGEVARGLEVIDYCCGLPELLKGGYSEQASSGVDVYSMRQPLGVVAGITPFNFPVMVPMWMWAPALACGNAFVLKPSEKDPSASLLRRGAAAARRACRTASSTSCTGDREAVDALLEHPGVDAVSFVGSTPIAKHVYETATRNGKRCQALGGAKNHMIVLPDADIDMAADAAISAAYGSAGERCMAMSQVVAVGPDRRRARRGDRAPDPRREGRRRHGPGVGDGTADHRRAPRPRGLLRRERPGRGRARGGGRPRRVRERTWRSSWGRRCSTTSGRARRPTTTRSSGPCWGSRASPRTRRRCGS